jgi:hypothetical protein
VSLTCTVLRVPVLQLLLKFNRVDEGTGWVFENYQLVSNDAVDDLLFFRFLDVVNVACLVQLCLAPVVTLLPVQHLVDVGLLFAAAVLVL